MKTIFPKELLVSKEHYAPRNKKPDLAVVSKYVGDLTNEVLPAGLRVVDVQVPNHDYVEVMVGIPWNHLEEHFPSDEGVEVYKRYQDLYSQIHDPLFRSLSYRLWQRIIEPRQLYIRFEPVSATS